MAETTTAVAGVGPGKDHRPHPGQAPRKDRRVASLSVRFLNFIESSKVFRRATLVITVWMTWRSFTWATELATAWMATEKPGLEFAAIIAATLAPISALQASVFKAYLTDGKEL